MFDYRRTSRRHRTLILACMLFWSILSYLAVRRYVLEGSRVEGYSMAPTLDPGDAFVISRLSYRLHEPRRGDIVAVRFDGDTTMSVKRIIALPGERVAIREGDVLINGRVLMEPYLAKSVRTEGDALGTHECEVAPGCYFVLGDNRGNSADSRMFGAVPRAGIEGVLLLWEPASPL